jgi:putative membrane protein
MMGFGIIWMLLFWGGLILLAFWLLAQLFPVSPRSPLSNSHHSPIATRDILDQRYARGELSREQYEEMRQTIRQ